MPKLGHIKATNINDEVIALFINEGLRTGNCRNRNPLSNKMVKDILNEYGLDFADLYTKKKDQ